MSRTSAFSKLQCYMRALSRDEEGAAAVIVALLLTVLLAFVAFGTDIAVIYRDQSQLQAHSDLTALGIAADLDEHETRLDLMLEENGLSPDAAGVGDVVLGRYLRNPAIPREDRFVPLDDTPLDDAPVANAVSVRLRTDAPLTFAQLFYDGDSVPLSASATASRTGAARFTLGSRFLGLDPGPLSNALTDLLGAQITLSAGDQVALDSEDINVGDFLDALANRMGFDPLNPADVLTNPRPLRLADFVLTMQDMLPAGVSGRLAQFTVLPVTFEAGIGDVFASDEDARDLGLTLTAFLGETEVSAYDLLIAAAEAVDGTSTSDVTLAAAIPDLAEANARLSFPQDVEDSGWVGIGERGTRLNTSFARLSTETEVATGQLSPLLANLATVTNLEASLPLYLEVAGASATLEELHCTETPQNEYAAVFNVDSDLYGDGAYAAALYLGQMDGDAFHNGTGVDANSLGHVDILEIEVLGGIVLQATVSVRSRAYVGRSRGDIRFTFDEIRPLIEGDVDGITKNFPTGFIVGTAVSNLLNPEHFDIDIEGTLLGVPVNAGEILDYLGLTETLLEGDIRANLTDLLPLADTLDTIIDDTLAAAGISLAEGELTLTGHHCERVQLVQ